MRCMIDKFTDNALGPAVLSSASAYLKDVG